MKNNLPLSGLRFNLLMIFFISICTSSLAQWTRKTDALKPRSDLSESIIYKSRLYTFLGFYDHERHANTTSDAYDPATDTYTLLAPIPDSTAAMTHEKIVLIDNTVWLIGGRLGQNPGPLTSAVWIYNITKDAWYKGPELKDPATGEPIPWAAGGAALLGRTLHIFGGFVINACDNDQSIYHLTLDVDSWLSDTTKPAQWKNHLTPLPIKRNHFSTVVLGGKIYALGGQFGHDCGGGQEKRFSHVYDPATDTWTELPLLQWARSHAEGSSFAIDGKIYIVGGQNAYGKSTDRVTIFNPAGNNGAGTWEDDSSFTLPAPYEGGTAKIINNTFIFSHGGQGTSAKPKSETYTRTITRNPVYKFGFTPGCLKLTADSGKALKGETLLFTIDSSKSYLVTSNAPWLTITKNATGIASPNAAVIELTAKSAGLAPGDYNAIITATGTGSGPIFSEATYCINLTVKSTRHDAHTLEAENAALSGIKIAKNHTDYSGRGFADYLRLSEDYIEWTVDKSAAGAVLLNFRYSNGRANDRPLQLSVNGVAANSNLSFPSTRSWEKWSTATIATNLNAGINKVRLTAIGFSGPNIDYLFYTNDTSVLSPRREALERSFTTKSFELLKVNVSPNPVSGSAGLILNTSSALPVNAEIIDISGRTYKKLIFFNTGSNRFPFSVKDMPPGIYMIRVTQGNSLATTKFIIE